MFIAGVDMATGKDFSGMLMLSIERLIFRDLEWMYLAHVEAQVKKKLYPPGEYPCLYESNNNSKAYHI